MAVELSYKIDPKDLESFKTMGGKVRTAAAVALTKVAKDAQAALKTEAGAVMHLRRSWVPQGIRITGANAGNLTAQVGSIDKYMARHVFGEEKTGKSLSISSTRDSQGRYAQGGLLIGLYNSIGSAKTHQQERKLLTRIDNQKKKTFQIIGRGDTILVVRRVGRGKIKGLEVLAAIKPQAKEKAIWHMDVTVAAIVGAKFMQHFEAAVDFGKQRRS